MMKKLATLLLFAAGMCAEDRPATKTFQLKYADPGKLQHVLAGYGIVNVDTSLRLIFIKTPDSATMTEVERLIHQYDVPPPPVQNVEVIIYIMSALNQPSTGSIPPELEGVVKQLRSMFSYKGYQLIDTQVLRVRAGQGGEASAVIDNKDPNSPKTVSQVKFRGALPFVDEKGRSIRIDG